MDSGKQLEQVEVISWRAMTKLGLESGILTWSPLLKPL